MVPRRRPRVEPRHNSAMRTSVPNSHNYAQRGQAALLTVLLLLMVTTFSVFSFVTPANTQAEIDRKTDAALAQAREALISYAIANSTQPGRFLCPDTSNNGQSASPCSGAVANRLGRLPWKTLLTPDLRDGYGERLWYAVSVDFLGSAGIRINSDTVGEYSVTGTQPANNVVAVIFSAGPSIGSQIRDTTSAICSTTGTAKARNLCAANYLDGGNNDGNTTFITGASSTTFNDRALAITQEALMQRLLVRVTGEARQALNYYYSGTSTLTANNHFPYASAYSDATRECTDGLLQGRVPLPGTGTAPITPPCKDANNWPSYPAWFDNNRWGNYLFYAVSPACASAATAATCITSGGLTVTGVSNNTRALIIATGRAYSGQSRPCVTVNDCLDDAENINGDNVFLRSTPSSTNNDQLRIVAP